MRKPIAVNQCATRSTQSKRSSWPLPRLLGDRRVAATIAFPDPGIKIVPVLLPVATAFHGRDRDLAEPLYGLVAVHLGDIKAHRASVGAGNGSAQHPVRDNHVW